MKQLSIEFHSIKLKGGDLKKLVDLCYKTDNQYMAIKINNTGIIYRIVDCSFTDKDYFIAVNKIYFEQFNKIAMKFYSDFEKLNF